MSIKSRAARPAAAAPQLASRRSGAGCALSLLVLVFVVGLMALALLLPPFSLGERLFGTPFVTLGKTTVEALTLDAGSASDLSVRVQSIAADVFLGQPGPDDQAVRAARTALPSALNLIGSVYWIEHRGSVAAPLALTFAPPPGADVARIDLYTYTTASGRWQFLPAQRVAAGGQLALLSTLPTLPDAVAAFRLAPFAPVLSVVVEPGQPLRPEVAALANAIHPAGLQPLDTGALQGVLPAGIEFKRGYAVIPVIRNFGAEGKPDTATIAGVLQDEQKRAEHVLRLVEFAISKPYTGLAIDYRDLPADMRSTFTEFLMLLGRELRAVNATLTVVLPFPEQIGDTGAYDWPQIGALADTVQMLTPLDARAFISGGVVEQTIAWATGQVSRAQLQVALMTQCVQEQGTALKAMPYTEALDTLAPISATPNQRVQAGEPVLAALTGVTDRGAEIALTDGVPTIRFAERRLWLTTGGVLRARLGSLVAANVAGVLLPDLSVSDTFSGALNALTDYKVKPAAQPWLVPVPAPLTLLWTVAIARDLPPVKQQAAPAAEKFAFTPDGSHPAVEIAVMVADFDLPLGSVIIRVIK